MLPEARSLGVQLQIGQGRVQVPARTMFRQNVPRRQPRALAPRTQRLRCAHLPRRGLKLAAHNHLHELPRGCAFGQRGLLILSYDPRSEIKSVVHLASKYSTDWCALMAVHS